MSVAHESPGRVLGSLAGRGALLLLLLACLSSCKSESAARTVDFDLAFRQETFDLLFGALDERYPYFDTLTVDWDTVVEEARRDALDARTREEFFGAIARALAELHDPHMGLELPIRRYRDSGIQWTIAPIEVLLAEGRLYLVDWPAESGARSPEPPGPMSAPELLSVDGCTPELGLLQALLSGPPETPVHLTLSWPDGTVSEHLVQRLPLGEPSGFGSSGSLLWDHSSWISWARRDDLGCIHVSTFSPERARSTARAMIDDIERAFDAMAGVETMILDLQYDTGGSLDVGLELGSYLVTEPTPMGRLPYRFLGIFPTTQELEMRPREEGFRGSLVVLVNGRTWSMAEHLARVLQTSGRATVIGEQTPGAEAAVGKVEARDGTVLSFGEEPLIPDGETSFQGLGVTPDQVVPLTIADVRAHGKKQARHLVHRARVRAALEQLHSSVAAENIPTPTVVDLIPGAR